MARDCSSLASAGVRTGESWSPASERSKCAAQPLMKASACSNDRMGGVAFTHLSIRVVSVAMGSFLSAARLAAAHEALERDDPRGVGSLGTGARP